MAKEKIKGIGKKRAKERFDASLLHSNIGTIGHVNHGKTTLASAITSVMSKENLAVKKEYDEIDNAPEERTRGITISASHVEFRSKKRHYSLIDCPGHSDYIKNMITGTSQMDGAILVISSEEGVKKQTKEHLLLAKRIGIEKIIVFLNDRGNEDFKDEEIREETKNEIIKSLEFYGFDKETPIIVASALKALKGDKDEEEKIVKLIEKIDEYFPLPKGDKEKPFLMYIGDKYVIDGIGTVVTGKVLRGKLRAGDETGEVKIIGFDLRKEDVAKSIEMHKKEVLEALPGYDIGVALRHTKVNEIRTGQVLTTLKNNVVSTKKIKVSAYVLDKEKDGDGRSTPFSDGYTSQFYFQTICITGNIKIDEDKEIVLGGLNEFTIEFKKDIVIGVGDNFIIREGKSSIAEGKVIEIEEYKAKK